MNEVAVAAGVSKATVSKVLSGKGAALRISPATQSQVRAVANQLGYVLGPIIRYRPAEIDDRPQDQNSEPTPPPPAPTPVEAEPPPVGPAPVSPVVEAAESVVTPPVVEPVSPVMEAEAPAQDPAPE